MCALPDRALSADPCCRVRAAVDAIDYGARSLSTLSQSRVTGSRTELRRVRGRCQRHQAARLGSSAEPRYPATAHGDAVVVLELTVATDGSVTTARAVEGPEPFASAAVEAAFAFRFEPARRAKKPIVARIRVEVRYVEPVAAPAPTNESQPPFFYVRGAPPGNLGYFIDGVRVPYLFRIGFGPSVIHPGLVERVELYPGA